MGVNLVQHEKLKFYFNLIKDDKYVLAACSVTCMLLMSVEMLFCQPDY